MAKNILLFLMAWFPNNDLTGIYDAHPKETVNSNGYLDKIGLSKIRNNPEIYLVDNYVLIGEKHRLYNSGTAIRTNELTLLIINRSSQHTFHWTRYWQSKNGIKLINRGRR